MQRALYSDVGGTNFVSDYFIQQYFTDTLAESFVLMSIGAEMLTGVTAIWNLWFRRMMLLLAGTNEAVTLLIMILLRKDYFK